MQERIRYENASLNGQTCSIHDVRWDYSIVVLIDYFPQLTDLSVEKLPYVLLRPRILYSCCLRAGIRVVSWAIEPPLVKYRTRSPAATCGVDRHKGSYHAFGSGISGSNGCSCLFDFAASSDGVELRIVAVSCVLWKLKAENQCIYRLCSSAVA